MPTTGWTPAHAAAKHNNQALIAILSRAGQDIGLIQDEKECLLNEVNWLKL